MSPLAATQHNSVVTPVIPHLRERDKVGEPEPPPPLCPALVLGPLQGQPQGRFEPAFELMGDTQHAAAEYDRSQPVRLVGVMRNPAAHAARQRHRHPEGQGSAAEQHAVGRGRIR
jgi:hypothetical protein